MFINFNVVKLSGFFAVAVARMRDAIGSLPGFLISGAAFYTGSVLRQR